MMIINMHCSSPMGRLVRAFGSRCIGVWLPMAAAVLACGCTNDGHQPTYPAGGMVTLGNGAPLPGGWIEFQLVGVSSAPTAKAKIQPDGRFQLGTYDEADGALEGTHRVLILPPMPPFINPDGPKSRPPINSELYPRIDPRYRRFDTSGLEFSVTSEPSKNRFEIRLEN